MGQSNTSYYDGSYRGALYSSMIPRGSKSIQSSESVYDNEPSIADLEEEVERLQSQMDETNDPGMSLSDKVYMNY
jgi:hypothetical protein